MERPAPFLTGTLPVTGEDRGSQKRKRFHGRKNCWGDVKSNGKFQGTDWEEFPEGKQ